MSSEELRRENEKLRARLKSVLGSRKWEWLSTSEKNWYTELLQEEEDQMIGIEFDNDDAALKIFEKQTDVVIDATNKTIRKQLHARMEKAVNKIMKSIGEDKEH